MFVPATCIMIAMRLTGKPKKMGGVIRITATMRTVKIVSVAKLTGMQRRGAAGRKDTR